MIRYYYPKTIEGVNIAIMDMFNDLTVYKYDSDDVSAAAIQVPITFGPVEKDYLDRTENFRYDASATDKNGFSHVEALGQRYYLSTPRIGFVLNDVVYDPNRAAGVNETREWYAENIEISGTDVDEILQDYEPTPYNYIYTLHIMTDSMSYMAQILENILPYFNPTLSLRVREFSFLNIERDLIVEASPVALEFKSEELDERSRREIDATVGLQVRGFMYRPFDYSKIIKYINTKYFVVDASNTAAVSALSASDANFDASNMTNLVISADYFSTSAVKFTSANEISSSAVPETYSFSGDYVDDTKYYRYFTSATINDG